ncbi:carboxypeptidase-like regulatory domain-containing protein [Devosia nitrariae]|uniref:Carboxypeptidase regulatory-like domain-containing protein n=1 Tax=Devosia nitrariae TaxID=2071872 RepID=A0ABQ5W1J2_9HYPH|nr:carboxypeptidase-like regulatory domain-containing protein [Devosia nitrariae]GLQ53957.1 hypothetical protein GCM10010862_12160 [Devosia nitrariae]
MAAQDSERDADFREDSGDTEELEPQAACIVTVDVTPGRITPFTEPAEPETQELEADSGDEDAGPAEVDAGAELTLIGIVECLPVRDLTQLSLLIQNEGGSLVGEAEISDFDGEINFTDELVLTAPLEPGEHTWLAVLPAHTADGIDYAEVTTPFRLVVKAHATSILVWDVPTAIVAGETFRFTLGVKCSSQCGPTGWTFAVSNEHGDAIATGTLGDEPWPGTAALYYAQVEASAPAAEGLHDWTVTAPGADTDIPHEQQTARFGVRSVRQPECVISVEAIDKATQAPIKGAKVVVHPYRVFTDADGHAEVRVPKGTYRIFVSGPRHVPYRADSQVAADTSIRAELTVDRGPTAAELWA